MKIKSALKDDFNDILFEAEYEAADALIEELSGKYKKILLTGHSFGGILWSGWY